MSINLICGDFYNEFPKVENNSINLILCDLPYGNGKTDLAWDKNPINLDFLWIQYKRILKPNGAVILNSVQPFTTDLINSNRKWFKYTYVWIKTQAANFQLAKKMPLKKHEDICVFYAKPPVYNPQMTKGELKGKRIGAKVYQNRKSDMYLSSKPANLEIVMNDVYYPTTILHFNNVPRNKSLHPTQKPVELLEFLIKTYTNEGDMVLDHCMGVGSTAVACDNLNRNFIGIEINEKYFEIGKERITQTLPEGELRLE